MTNIKISTSLEQKITYYLEKTKREQTFEEFVDYQLKQGLQNLILTTKSKLENSFRCGHLGPMIFRRVYSVMGEKKEYFICEKCSKLAIYDKFEEEERIEWGDVNS